ncbi:conjugal transfer protein [Lacticaseibacillus paracasei]|uniref:conjugal transfer protein n=1 Tax=Lacticaseibacillus paracasei TaxID=1597 RepID=UPI000F439DD0|nr:conjugal transfer protein [Lacticaseibacillus paracasei]RND41251.1 hypothetical protein FAM10859_00672 [Lacticaseibacillus paracasei]
MKKGKEFIFPENVNKDYGVWKDYTIKDIGIGLAGGLVGIVLLVLPPYNPWLLAIKFVVVLLALVSLAAILTVKPVAARKNIKVRDMYQTKARYRRSQKRYYLAPQPKGGSLDEK